MKVDKNCLSYWFPIIEAAGVPVPKTRIVTMPDAAHEAAFSFMDGNDPAEPHLAAWNGFVEEIKSAADDLGWPAFLRTGHTSHKHGWRETCFLADRDAVDRHVFALIEFSECASLMGLPYKAWAVREMLPTKPFGACSRYRDMPACREFRFFVDGADIVCAHPYWPRDALVEGGCGLSAEYYEILYAMGEAELELRALASAVGDAIGGAWSVDILETERGWFVTDMAVAADSFHWEGCPNARPRRLHLEEEP